MIHFSSAVCLASPVRFFFTTNQIMVIELALLSQSLLHCEKLGVIEILESKYNHSLKSCEQQSFKEL